MVETLDHVLVRAGQDHPVSSLNQVMLHWEDDEIPHLPSCSLTCPPADVPRDGKFSAEHRVIVASLIYLSERFYDLFDCVRHLSTTNSVPKFCHDEDQSHYFIPTLSYIA